MNSLRKHVLKTLNITDERITDKKLYEHLQYAFAVMGLSPRELELMHILEGQLDEFDVVEAQQAARKSATKTMMGIRASQ